MKYEHFVYNSPLNDFLNSNVPLGVLATVVATFLILFYITILRIFKENSEKYKCAILAVVSFFAIPVLLIAYLSLNLINNSNIYRSLSEYIKISENPRSIFNPDTRNHDEYYYNNISFQAAEKKLNDYFHGAVSINVPKGEVKTVSTVSADKPLILRLDMVVEVPVNDREVEIRTYKNVKVTFGAEVQESDGLYARPMR